jgi:SAM-dependent methyltransferase
MPLRTLPERAYALFDAKGPENAARVRRIVRLVSALHSKPKDWSGLRLLDLGCGEGLFALEAALHGAEVTAIDGRDERMSAGRALARELALTNLQFIKADVRSHPFDAHGTFDSVLCLGLLYHLDAPDLFEVAERAARATGSPDQLVRHEGSTYRGWRYREHRPEDAEDVRRGRLLASLSNESSLWLTPDSILTLLQRAGFPTVLQCHVPFRPFESEDRFTLVALKGGAPEVLSFPWINEATNEDVQHRTRSKGQILPMPPTGSAREDAVTDVVVTLGGWVRDRPEFVLGTPRAGSAAIWRRRDLDAYRGGLRRIAPLLSVEVSGLGETEQELCEAAACARAAGVGVVWLVLPEASGVLVVASQASGRYGAGDVLPEPLGLIGLSPPVNALLRQRP